MGELTALVRPPELLTTSHRLDGFECAEASLASWLRERARPNQSSGASRTYVLTRSDVPGDVVGFYALAPGAIDVRSATPAIRRNSPSPVPVFLLARLAVHADWGGRGLGSGLLKDAYLRAQRASAIVGGKALVTHAIDDTAKGFYLKHGLIESPLCPLTLMVGLSS